MGQWDSSKHDTNRGLKNASTVGIALLLPLGTPEITWLRESAVPAACPPPAPQTTQLANWQTGERGEPRPVFLKC